MVFNGLLFIWGTFKKMELPTIAPAPLCRARSSPRGFPLLLALLISAKPQARGPGARRGALRPAGATGAGAGAGAGAAVVLVLVLVLVLVPTDRLLLPCCQLPVATGYWLLATATARQQAACACA
jgi:hypothetical protein